MKVGNPEFSRLPFWYGRRLITLDVGSFKVSEIAGSFREISDKCKYPLLVELRSKGPGLVAPNIGDLLRVGKTKGYQFGYRFHCQHFCEGQAPSWCDDLDELVLEIYWPRKFDFHDAFSNAIQTFWFMSGNLSVAAYCSSTEDLDMVRFLCSLVPTDIPFYVIGSDEPESIEENLAADPYGLRFARGPVIVMNSR